MTTYQIVNTYRTPAPTQPMYCVSKITNTKNIVLGEQLGPIHSILIAIAQSDGFQPGDVVETPEGVFYCLHPFKGASC